MVTPSPHMLPTHLFYHAVHGAWPPTGDARCWLCGAACAADGPAADDVVRSTFNDHARARRGGDSAVCCAACAFYFDFKILREGGARAMGLFTKTVLVTPDAWREWEREAMADDLLGWHATGLPAPTVLALNYSKQKHVLPWARVNAAGTRRPWIATDQGAVRLPDAFPALVGAVATLWARGYPKGALARGELAAFVLSRSDDPARDLRTMAVLAPSAATPTLDLCTYVTTETNRDRLARECPPVL